MEQRLSDISRDLKMVFGATRLLLLPLLGYPVSCAVLEKLTQGITVNYMTKDRVVTVGPGTGSLRHHKVPCALDPRRMPPLRRYIAQGLLTPEYAAGPNYKTLEDNFRHLARLYMWGCAGNLYTVAKCIDAPLSAAREAIAHLRVLYPTALEIYKSKPYSQTLGKPGQKHKLEDFWTELYHYVETGVATRRGIRKVRTWTNKYAVPEILQTLNFRDAIVADVGSGFGTKGAYTIRKGAKFVILIDIDPKILKARGTGALIDKLAADVQKLPIRKKSIDATIFWNVLQFVEDEDAALAEISRTTRQFTVMSIYNAASALRQYTWQSFLQAAKKLGAVIDAKNLANRQFQAVVKHEN